MLLTNEIPIFIRFRSMGAKKGGAGRAVVTVFACTMQFIYSDEFCKYNIKFVQSVNCSIFVKKTK